RLAGTGLRRRRSAAGGRTKPARRPLPYQGQSLDPARVSRGGALLGGPLRDIGPPRSGNRSALRGRQGARRERQGADRAALRDLRYTRLGRLAASLCCIRRAVGIDPHHTRCLHRPADDGQRPYLRIGNGRRRGEAGGLAADGRRHARNGGRPGPRLRPGYGYAARRMRCGGGGDRGAERTGSGGMTVDCRVISADNHINEPPWVFDRVPGALKDRAPKMMRGTDGGDGWSFDGQPPKRTFGIEAMAGYAKKDFRLSGMRFDELRPGNYDGAAHLKDMDIDGVYGSVTYPAHVIFTYIFPDRELALACLRSYNDWIIEDFQSADPKRLIALPLLPTEDGMET